MLERREIRGKKFRNISKRRRKSCKARFKTRKRRSRIRGKFGRAICLNSSFESGLPRTQNWKQTKGFSSRAHSTPRGGRRKTIIGIPLSRWWIRAWLSQGPMYSRRQRPSLTVALTPTRQSSILSALDPFLSLSKPRSTLIPFRPTSARLDIRAQRKIRIIDSMIAGVSWPSLRPR